MPRYDQVPGVGRVRAYDFGAKYADRWLVLFEDFEVYDGTSTTLTKPRPYGPRFSLSMSDHPQHPQGVGLSGETRPPQTFGRGTVARRVPFAKLPPDVQRCVQSMRD